MSDLFTKIDLAELQALAAETAPTYHHLSDTTRQLCLDMLTRFPSYRWAWRNDGDELTDEEWDTASAMAARAAQELIKTMLTGAIFPFAGEIIPDGFLICNGQSVSRDEYNDLFAMIGVTYGSSSLTTFNLPDLRGRVPVGLDTTQAEFDALGEVGGQKTHALTTGEMPAHDHPHTHSEVTAAATIINGGLEAPAAAALPGVGITGSGGTSAGGGEAHNNLQPYLTINFIIKT
jgi:microcystin-dependent protein